MLMGPPLQIPPARIGMSATPAAFAFITTNAGVARVYGALPSSGHSTTPGQGAKSTVTREEATGFVAMSRTMMWSAMSPAGQTRMHGSTVQLGGEGRAEPALVPATPISVAQAATKRSREE